MGGPEIEHLIWLLAKLPGMGPRSARRAALKLLQQPDARMLPLASALAEAARSVKSMRSVRQSGQPRSVRRSAPIRSATAPDLCCRGRRRSMGAGAFAPCIAACTTCSAARCRRLSGVGPEDLNVTPLLARVGEGGVTEVILALGATVDGATTAHWLTDRLRPLRRDRDAGRPRRADRRCARCAGRWHARRRIARSQAFLNAPPSRAAA